MTENPHCGIQPGAANGHLRLLQPWALLHGHFHNVHSFCDRTPSIHDGPAFGKGRGRDLRKTPPKAQKAGRGILRARAQVFHVKHSFYSRSFFFRMNPATAMMATEMSSGGQKLPAKGSQPTFMP